jgi:tetratricopeptide (TPR) repeat protein
MMVMMRWIKYGARLVVCLALVCSVGCSRNPLSEEQKEEPDPKQTVAAAQAKKLTEQAYDHKLAGQNGKALALFEKAGKVLVAAHGETHYQVASNLDDQATVYLRTGDFSKAQELYQEAKAVLKKIGQNSSRLDQAIDRRLHTLNTFEKNAITCSEPLEPKNEKETESLPYFPKAEEMEPVFDTLAKELGDCVETQKLPVPVRLVVTGTGRIVEAHVKGLYNHTEAGLCIEKKILQRAPTYAAALPRFRACYKNVTYPFVIGR